MCIIVICIHDRARMRCICEYTFASMCYVPLCARMDACSNTHVQRLPAEFVSISMSSLRLCRGNRNSARFYFHSERFVVGPPVELRSDFRSLPLDDSSSLAHARSHSFSLPLSHTGMHIHSFPLQMRLFLRFFYMCAHICRLWQNNRGSFFS
jgi:hypothetical protein